MKVLLIRWLDHQSLSGWIEPINAVNFCASKNMEATSVGILVYQNDDFVVIAQTFSEDNEHHGELLKVMRSCIKSIKTVYMEK